MLIIGIRLILPARLISLFRATETSFHDGKECNQATKKQEMILRIKKERKEERQGEGERNKNREQKQEKEKKREWEGREGRKERQKNGIYIEVSKIYQQG